MLYNPHIIAAQCKKAGDNVRIPFPEIGVRERIVVRASGEVAVLHF